MAFSSTVEGTDIWGRWRVKWGTFTNAGGDTGGDIDTGCGNILAFFLSTKGAAAVAKQNVVNETFPDFTGPNVTIVCNDGDDGTWLAIEGETVQPSTTTGETTTFDTSVVGNKVFAIGSIAVGANGTSEVDLTHCMEKVEAFHMTLKGAATDADTPVVNEDFPIDGTAITVDATDNVTIYFLAIGVKGGV